MDTSLFRKADSFCCPASTWTVQNSLDNADAGRSLTQDYPAPLIDSPIGHYTNIGTHSSSLCLLFLAIASESSGTLLRSAQRHEYTLPRLLETSEVGTPLYSGHFRWHQWCPYYRGSTVLHRRRRATLLLLCNILNTNLRASNRGGLGMRLSSCPTQLVYSWYSACESQWL